MVLPLSRMHDVRGERREIRGRFFDPFLIKGLKYPVRNKSH